MYGSYSFKDVYTNQMEREKLRQRHDLSPKMNSTFIFYLHDTTDIRNTYIRIVIKGATSGFPILACI